MYTPLNMRIFKPLKYLPLYVAVVALLGDFELFGQIPGNKNIPKDTSFNVRSAYLKEKKKFPFIEIAEPDLPLNVIPEYNVVYLTLPNTPYGKRELRLDIFCPDDSAKGRFPGVVLVHGGGWRSGDRSHLVPFAQQLAKNGYVAATIEYRLSDEAEYPASVNDVKAAIRWLKVHGGKYHLDKEKLALLGCSSGAQLVSLVGTASDKFSDDMEHAGESAQVQAVVNIDGILSFIHPEASEEGKSASFWLGGDRVEKYETWKEASALEYVDEHTPPFLFINSSIPRFHAGRDDFIKKLDKYGTYSEVHTLPDTPHPFWLFNPWFPEVVNLTVAFLDEIFKD